MEIEIEENQPNRSFGQLKHNYFSIKRIYVYYTSLNATTNPTYKVKTLLKKINPPIHMD